MKRKTLSDKDYQLMTRIEKSDKKEIFDLFKQRERQNGFVAVVVVVAMIIMHIAVMAFAIWSIDEMNELKINAYDYDYMITLARGICAAKDAGPHIHTTEYNPNYIEVECYHRTFYLDKRLPDPFKVALPNATIELNKLYATQ